MNKLFSILLLLTSLPLVHAEDRIELEGTSIFGNQELPKVLYIVPWKDSELPQLQEPPLESLIDQALAPIDRSEFRRQVIYFDALSIQADKSK
jgi:2'-5' RNA ligase